MDISFEFLDVCVLFGIVMEIKKLIRAEGLSREGRWNDWHNGLQGDKN